MVSRIELVWSVPSAIRGLIARLRFAGCVLSLVLAASQARAGFIDGFEGSTIDPFWSSYIVNGSITLSSDVAHSGTQSAKFSSNGVFNNRYEWLFHTFSTPVYGTASVWIYDTGAGVPSSNYIGFYITNDSQNFYAALSTFDYGFAGGGPGRGDQYDYGTSGPPPFVAASGVDRTLAWHQYEIIDLPQTLTIKLDGATLYEQAGGTPFDTIRLASQAPGFRPAFDQYYDDFVFSVAPVPEPSTFALLCLGGIGLAISRSMGRRLFRDFMPSARPMNITRIDRLQLRSLKKNAFMRVAIVAVAFAFAGGSASAGQITYDFAGTIVPTAQFNSSLPSGVQVGNPYTGTLIYDDSVPGDVNQIPDTPGHQFYHLGALLELTVQIGTATFSATNARSQYENHLHPGMPVIVVDNYPIPGQLQDQISAIGGSYDYSDSSHHKYTVFGLDLYEKSANPTALTSSSLIGLNLDLANFTTIAAINFLDWDLNSITNADNSKLAFTGSSTSLELHAVPEPSSIVIVCTGTLGLLVYRSRRRSVWNVKLRKPV